MSSPVSCVETEEGYRLTCYFCDEEWGDCSCFFPSLDDPDADGFEFGGIHIIEWNLTPCTRFFVNPVVYYGEAYLKFLRCEDCGKTIEQSEIRRYIVMENGVGRPRICWDCADDTNNLNEVTK